MDATDSLLLALFLSFVYTHTLCVHIIQAGQKWVAHKHRLVQKMRRGAASHLGTFSQMNFHSFLFTFGFM